MYKVVRVMSGGPEGFQRALNGLKLGMERLFPLTSTHQLSFTLFLYEMECLLLSDDQPRNLIAGAIDRAESHDDTGAETEGQR